MRLYLSHRGRSAAAIDSYPTPAVVHLQWFGLKPNEPGFASQESVFEHLQNADEKSVCCELAHIYHYYLHGPSGNRADPTSDVQDNGSVADCSQMTAASRKQPAAPPPSDVTSLRGPLPDLVVQKFDCGDLAWRYVWRLPVMPVWTLLQCTR